MQENTRLGGRYRLERRLAAGGMGEVWLGRDTSLNREVAVKLLPVDSQGDAAAVERFRREATTTAGLQHPNIVSILDAGSHEGSAFIVMELLTGPTLAQLVADRGPLPEAEVVSLAAQIAAGLGAAHRAGVIHRDLKPSNLMFGPSGGLKILDFGIARLAQDTSSRLTATNAIIGSAPYLSPEQATGASADERSDLYALGCILTTMITSSPPFTGEHPVAVLHQHVHEHPPLLRQRQPAVSPGLESLVQHLLDKSPELRPQSAEIVERQLAIIADSRGGAVHTTTPLATTPAMPATIPMAHAGQIRTSPTLVQASVSADLRSRTPPSAPRGIRRIWRIAVLAFIGVAVMTGAALVPLLAPTHETAGTPTAPRTATRAPTPTPSRPGSTATPSPRTTPQPTPSRLSTTSPSPRTKPTRPKPKAGKTHHPRKHHGSPPRKHG